MTMGTADLAALRRWAAAHQGNVRFVLRYWSRTTKSWQDYHWTDDLHTAYAALKSADRAPGDADPHYRLSRVNAARQLVDLEEGQVLRERPEASALRRFFNWFTVTSR